jgi:U3 small nucleolar RNA-associated protein 19
LFDVVKIQHVLRLNQGKFYFPTEMVYRITEELVGFEVEAVVIESFMQWLENWSDLRYYILLGLKQTLEKSLNATNVKYLVKNGFSILSKLEWMPLRDSDLKPCFVATDSTEAVVLSFKNHRKVFTECWLNYLSLPLPIPYYKSVLGIIDTKVMPFMNDPCILMDFFTQSYDSGGIISLLSLNGIFRLIVSYNLDYPEFYPKLYALLDLSLAHIHQHRTQFFKLASLFLSSSHLPAYLIAAFIKRFARMCLTAPPATILIVIPFIYNLLKQHPECMVMIHRSNKEHAQANDPYDYVTRDLKECKAIESSLWELIVMMN